MDEIKDYSGEFRPNLKFEDFSKETLVKMWYAASKLYYEMNGSWYDLVREKLGEQMAADWNREVWFEKGMYKRDPDRVMQAINIVGQNDVTALLKMFQCDAGTAGVIDIECQMEGKNRGIVTATRCRPLEQFERLGDTCKTERECLGTCVEGMNLTAQYINPKMTMRPLKLPPRESKDEICCQFEVKLEE